MAKISLEIGPSDKRVNEILHKWVDSMSAWIVNIKLSFRWHLRVDRLSNDKHPHGSLDREIADDDQVNTLYRDKS